MNGELPSTWERAEKVLGMEKDNVATAARASGVWTAGKKANCNVIKAPNILVALLLKTKLTLHGRALLWLPAIEFH